MAGSGEKDRPLVSVVVPSYNQGRFINETLNSILGQDYPRIEVLVMDGGSTDNTLDILKSYGDRITWVSERDRGQADAINKGWRVSKGNIIAWLNSDDVYLPGAISHAVSILESDPECLMVYGEGYHVDEGGNVIERYPTEPFDFKRLEEVCFICQPTVFMRREVLRLAGMLDGSLNFAMDYDYWIRVGKAGKIVHTDRFLAQSRFYAAAKTLAGREQAHREYIRMLKRRLGYVPMKWIYNYPHVLFAWIPRRYRLGNDVFVILLILFSLWMSLALNGRIPREESPLWRVWIKGILKR